MLGLGYLLAGFAPVVTGALRDLTGGFEVPMLLLACAGFLSGCLAFLIPAAHHNRRSAGATP
jgi:cyanate permease